MSGATPLLTLPQEGNIYIRNQPDASVNSLSNTYGGIKQARDRYTIKYGEPISIS